jgi:protein involved in polysaccharide export with SLBB domain
MMKHNHLLLTFIVIVIFSIILLAGCQSSPKKLDIESVNASTQEYIDTDVTLDAGDVLIITFFYTPELNTEQTIRPDGKIDLQLIGEVKVSGKTPQELKEELIEKYSKKIQQLDISITVQSFYNRRVYVGGAVAASTSIPIPGQLTALEAIILAGGIDPGSGKYKNILLIRRENGIWTGKKFDLEKILSGAQTDPIYLRPLDIVYVPETNITRVKRWIDQHIGIILPEIGFTYNINPDAPNTWGVNLGYTPGN